MSNDTDVPQATPGLDASCEGQAPPDDQMIGSVEELAAAIEDGRIKVEVPPSEPPPEEEWFYCRKGHWQLGEYFIVRQDPVTKEVIWHSGPLCATCQGMYLAGKCPTRRRKRPEKKAD